MDTQVIGLKELLDKFKNLEKLPAKVVNRAAKAGAKQPLAVARSLVPKGKTKNLKKGIYLRAEKSKVKGKKVYQLSFRPEMSNVFVKESKSGKRAYYPASIEYGFITKNGGYVPGKHFLKRAMEMNYSSSERIIIDTFVSELEKIK